MAPKKKQDKKPTKAKPKSPTDFPVLLTVTEDGKAHWIGGARDYTEAIKLMSQRQNYDIQQHREQEMRRQFDHYTARAAEQKRQRELKLIQAEEKYGQAARQMLRDGMKLEDIAVELEIDFKTVKEITKEVLSHEIRH